MARPSRRSAIFMNDETSDSDAGMADNVRINLTPEEEKYIQTANQEIQDWKQYHHTLKCTESKLKKANRDPSLENFDYHKYLNDDDLDILKEIEKYEEENLKVSLDKKKNDIIALKKAVEQQKKEMDKIFSSKQLQLYKLSNLSGDSGCDMSFSLDISGDDDAEPLFSEED